MTSAYDHRLVENKWNLFWEKHQFFKADPQSKKPPYSIILPPPNVTGRLHMGHALGGAVQDLFIRIKRMQGFETLWLPGLDHAGISTQTVVEKQLMKTMGKTRKEFDRETFLNHVWEWKEEHGDVICSQLKKLGFSLDWSRQRFTMDEKSNQAVRVIFKRLYDQGLIYRGDYLVNWDPVTQTALSDDEVEYEEQQGFLYQIRYRLASEEGYLIVATTRPETLLGDTAIAVHPNDPRYQHLIGQVASVPIVERQIPIIADPFVDPEFGTGCVKVTPAHDFNDYETGLRHHLPMINIMTPDGRINENGLVFEGLSMLEARQKIVVALKQADLIQSIEPHLHRVGKSYRSKAVVEPYLSKQWFVKMSAFKEDLLSAVKSGQIELIPSHYDKTYFHWIENIRDWCISRQLWWGHRIPVYYHIHDPSVIICSDSEHMPPEVAKNPELYRQDDDVLDTWFSSALWPFSTLGWPEKTAEFDKFFPTSMLVTGHDILFFWVARMIMMSQFACEQPPFFKTFIHGLIYGKSFWRQDASGSIQYVTSDERKKLETVDQLPPGVHSKWEKMSKSKGNVIDPIEMIEQYGADAVRMALLASLTDSRQIDLDSRRFEEYKNFANKLWNAARFVMMNLKPIEDPDALTVSEYRAGLQHQLLQADDRWILSRLQGLIEQCLKAVEACDCDHIALSIYTFFWDEFCAYYLETAKPYMSRKVDRPGVMKEKQKILLYVLLNAIRLLHPITPFITEEIFQMIRQRFDVAEPFSSDDPFVVDIDTSLRQPSLCICPYPKPLISHHVQQDEEKFALIQQVVYAIRNLRGEMQIPPATVSTVLFSCDQPDDGFDMICENFTIMNALVKIQCSVESVKPGTSMMHQRVGNIQIAVLLPQDLIAKEEERLCKEQEKLIKQLASLQNQMSNPEFTAKAPSHLIEKTQETIALTEKKLSDIAIKLNKKTAD